MERESETEDEEEEDGTFVIQTIVSIKLECQSNTGVPDLYVLIS